MNITIITKENIMKRADITVGDRLAWQASDGHQMQVIVLDTYGWEKIDGDKEDHRFHLDGKFFTMAVPGRHRRGAPSILVATVKHDDTWDEDGVRVVPLRRLLGDWAPVGESIRLDREAQLRSYREADERFRQERGW